MTSFLLLGSRRAERGELSPASAARDLIAITTWQHCLRRWGLLRAFAVSGKPQTALRACLIVRASDHAAAEDLAIGWGRIGGYDVAVLPLVEVLDQHRTRA